MLLACVCHTAAGADIVVTDDLGHELRLENPARRIVALSPHLVENLFAIGAGNDIVATVAWSDYPPAANDIPRIGNNQALSVEAILAKQPDLVAAWASGNGQTLITRLRELGLPVYASEPSRLADVGATLLNLGKLTGQELQAKEIAQSLTQSFKDLGRRAAGKSAVKVFYQIWHDPLQTINAQHLISDVIRLCGGVNVFADAPALAPRLSVEAVIAAGPDVIVSSQTIDEMQQFWAPWTSIRAVKAHQLHRINPDILHRHTPRLLQGAAQLCDVLQAAR